jgi:hypothetical protein
MKPVDDTLKLNSVSTYIRWDANPGVEAGCCMHSMCPSLVPKGHTTGATITAADLRCTIVEGIQQGFTTADTNESDDPDASSGLP